MGRISGPANIAPESLQKMRKYKPILLMHLLHQVKLYLLGSTVFGQAEPLRDSYDMSINNNPLKLIESVSHHDICSLPSDSRQFQKVFHFGWHPAAELINDHFRGCYNVFCLIPVKPR